MKIASQLARDILAMEDEIDFLRGEVARLEGYRQKYEDLLACSVSYSERMIGGLLAVAMTPGVMDAIGKHNATKEGEHARANLS